MENTWAVIKFPNEDDAVAAVPTSWLRGNECYWPPWNKDRIDSAIQSSMAPDTETWQVHPFTPLRNNVFDDFKSAKRKMKKATETSDLESQTETDHGKKRRVVKTSLTRFASFEIISDDEKTETETCIVPKPPKFKSMSKLNTTTVVEHKRSCEQDDRSQASISQTPTTGPKIAAPSEDHLLLGSSQPGTLQTPTRGPNVAPASRNQLVLDYLKKILRKQDIIQNALTELTEEVTVLRSKIDGNTLQNGDDGPAMFIDVELPVNREEDLQELEAYLSDASNMSAAVKEVASSGGKTIYELIYRAAQKLISNGYASNYSYFGRQRKESFKKLKLNDLLKKAALKSFPHATEKDAEMAIAKWLRRCTERAKKE